MKPTLGDDARHQLRDILERGAEEASRALSKWLGRPTSLQVSAVEEVELTEAADLLGPADELVAACSMELVGRIGGKLLLVFEDRSGLALADLLLRQSLGTSREWGELEQSAANETANIVGCAYLNSLAAHLPNGDPIAEGEELSILPSPPSFRHEFAGSLIEFALMDQAVASDRLLLIRTRFEVPEGRLDWWLLLVPDGESLAWLASALSSP
jgi:chemotaxis protein CheC